MLKEIVERGGLAPLQPQFERDTDQNTRLLASKEITMPKDQHNAAADHHDKASKSHRSAAEQHGKGEPRSRPKAFHGGSGALQERPPTV
jgi:hypothetical protein